MNPTEERLDPAGPPGSPSGGDRAAGSWRYRLSFKLIVGLLLVFALFNLSAYLAMRLYGREVIAEHSDKLTHETGRKLVLQLQEHIEASEALARTLATLGETLPRDVAVFKGLVPDVLNLENKRELIAGGGIWPEPEKFTEGVARRSFFWGRNRDGVLEYFDDYNAPEGPGYHNEEWYEPARHAKPGQVYWSKSYMDPYSFEPMVTCTVPMRRAGVFSGVATVDLKLNGIGAIMRELARETGGYAFVVDRNNNFICFPDQSLASRVRVSADGKRVQEQRDVANVASEHSGFAPVATLLEQADREAHARAVHAGGARIRELTQILQARIAPLSPEEALRIAVGLLGTKRTNAPARRVDLAHDLVLAEHTQMLIYEMPSTHWKVALAMPVRQAQAVVATVIERVALFLLAVSLIVCAAAWFFFNRAFLRPLSGLTSRLRELATGRDHQARLPVHGRDELAQLACLFNLRTGMLEQAFTELEKKSRLIDDARLAAENADRSKNIFLASMSHELRTPLNAIIGMSSFIQGTRLDAEQTEYARTIHSSSNALLDLVNDIMDFSKIEAGQLEFDQADFDLRTILDEVSDILSHPVSEKGLRFSCLLDPASDGRVRGDAGRIRQIISNLAANAVKFTKQGEVEILGRVLDDGSPLGLMLTFTVRDTGVGIPEEARDRLFKPYSQGQAATTRLYGGTGLGLAICKRLCELLHGDISYTSQPGEGTTFRFHVRMAPADRTALPGVAPSVPRAADWHCVIVEPHAPYGNFLQRQITRWGINATHVNSADEMAAHVPTVAGKSILCICGVDERTSPGTNLRLRQAAAGRTTKAILHLQTNLGESGTELAKGGYDAFVSRPLRIAQLAKVIQNLLSHTPAATGPAGQQAEGKPADPAASLILVVEDNRLNQKVIIKMLANLGYKQELAENGVQAVEQVTRKHYDLILMDWHMPLMDGLEATQRIRQLGGHCSTMPIIALTASALQNERKQCFVAGMNDYLSKPITEKTLKTMLQKWLACGPAAECELLSKT